ncbi:Hypp8905 [Branchiostoma lanceolatum]|uniref:Hypp8905 protein n=1 Tax=Branchiostoma lanceolatum TaxID=7740 RepID=A0A8K0EF59_BRALA|nr:Hypp8905 [Branchiostoma lanceolatum]
MADKGDREELYSLLGLPSTATHAEVVEAYKREIVLYEEASKLSKKSSVYKEAYSRHREVSKAFFVLSDASNSQEYNDSGVTHNSPKRAKKSRRQRRDYCVKHNAQSITVLLPQNLTKSAAKSWLTTCEDYYDTKATDGGTNGLQINTTYSDATSNIPAGTVTIKVYESGQKLLIQGSAYLLWFSEMFPVLRKKVDSTSVHAEVPADNSSSNSDDFAKSVTEVNPSLCQSCDQPLSSDVCPLCNTVPKDLRDVNSNAVDFPESEPQKDIPVNHDYVQVQDNINKLETCLIESIADRKLFEDSISQRMSALESKQNSCQRVCDSISVAEVRKLKEDIVRLEGVKCELEHQVRSLKESLAELAAVVCNAPVKISTETQTANEQSVDQDSHRADKLIQEIVSVNVQNRFEVLGDISDRPDTDISHMGSKHGTRGTADSKPNQSTRSARREKTAPDETTKINQQNKDPLPDILILGDSNTKALKPDILYPNKCVKKDLTFNLTEATQYIQHSELTDPAVILFHVGTNDVRRTPDAGTVTEGFRNLIQTAHDKYPRSNLVLSSILPRDDPTLQDIGDDVNIFLKVAANEASYVHIIDNANFVDSGTIKSALYTSDGYHVNRSGIRVLAANIKRAVNPLLGLGQYTARRNQPAAITISQNRSYRDALIGSSDGATPTLNNQAQPSHSLRPVHNSTSGHDRRPVSTPSPKSVQGRNASASETVPEPAMNDKNELSSSTFRRPVAPWSQPPPFGPPPFGPPPFGPWSPPVSPLPPPGPWSPPVFRPPGAPWGPPPGTRANATPNQPHHGPSQMNPPPMPPWSWHRNMMWPPLFAMW